MMSMVLLTILYITTAHALLSKEELISSFMTVDPDCNLPRETEKLRDPYCDYIERLWYYDVKSHSCKSFWSGNCRGSLSTFHSLNECDIICPAANATTSLNRTELLKKLARKDNCPMFKCVPCQHGYLRDNRGCQNCGCKPVKKVCYENCTLTYDPVCGSNGATYNNMCFLKNAKCTQKYLTKLYDGPCTNDPCKGKCLNGATCEKDSLNVKCECPKYFHGNHCTFDSRPFLASIEMDIEPSYINHSHKRTLKRRLVHALRKHCTLKTCTYMTAGDFNFKEENVLEFDESDIHLEHVESIKTKRTLLKFAVLRKFHEKGIMVFEAQGIERTLQHGKDGLNGEEPRIIVCYFNPEHSRKGYVIPVAGCVLLFIAVLMITVVVAYKRKSISPVIKKKCIPDHIHVSTESFKKPPPYSEENKNKHASPPPYQVL